MQGRSRNLGLQVRKYRKEGTKVASKRVATWGVRLRAKKVLSPQGIPAFLVPLPEIKIRLAIVVLVQRNHSGVDRYEWPEISLKIFKNM